MRRAHRFASLLVLVLTLAGGSVFPAVADVTSASPVPPRQHTLAFAGDGAGDPLDGALFSADLGSRGGDGDRGRGLVPKWTLALSMVTTASPHFADVNGDGVQEIVLPTMGPPGTPYGTGKVFIFDRAGNDLPGWPVTTTSPFPSSAAIADLDHNGDMEVIAESWGYVHVWNHDGTNFPGWPKAHGTGYTVAPAIADVDGDGNLEIIISTGTRMNVWHPNGTMLAGWPFTAPKPLAAAAVADIDGDGALEIVAGCWEGPYPGTGPFPLYAWKANGTLLPGFPLTPPGQTRGPVSLADIDRDGQIEIVARINDLIYVWDHHGVVKPGWPVNPNDAIRNSATAVGDLDGDGYLEIVIAGYKAQAFNHDGTPVPGFPAYVPPGTRNIVAGPVIADMDGDPTKIEIVVHSADTFYAVHSDGTAVTDFPYTLSDDGNSATFAPAAAVGDLDGNGQVEYVFVSVSGRVAYFDEPRAYAEKYAYWPVFEHDSRNTCHLPSQRLGDLNCDGAVDFGDIDPFVLALSDPAGYAAAYPNCDIQNGDCNADGNVDFGDIDPFVALLSGG